MHVCVCVFVTGDIIYVGRYLVCGADSASLYLEVESVVGECMCVCVCVCVSCHRKRAWQPSIGVYVCERESVFVIPSKACLTQLSDAYSHSTQTCTYTHA